MVSPGRVPWSPAVLYRGSRLAISSQWRPVASSGRAGCPIESTSEMFDLHAILATWFHYQHLLRKTHQPTVASLKGLLPCHGFPLPSALRFLHPKNFSLYVLKRNIHKDF